MIKPKECEKCDELVIKSQIYCAYLKKVIGIHICYEIYNEVWKEQKDD